MQNITLSLFADYFQFYIQDDDTAYGDLSDAWTPEAVGNLLAVSDHVIGVGTVRNMDVPVYLAIADEFPALEPSDWDRINYSSIECDTGRLVVAGCTEYFPDATRVEVEPGIYRIAVGYRNLTKISEDGLNGEDSYHLYLSRER